MHPGFSFVLDSPEMNPELEDRLTGPQKLVFKSESQGSQMLGSIHEDGSLRFRTAASGSRPRPKLKVSWRTTGAQLRIQSREEPCIQYSRHSKRRQPTKGEPESFLLLPCSAFLASWMVSSLVDSSYHPIHLNLLWKYFVTITALYFETATV